ncbi:MAG: nitronate monooxygenase [Synergistaceae bacterium]|nr:nitronate monooxygenase [Synergistaceae bacterium]
MAKNRIQEILGIKYPIVQASMTWITNAEFVAAVSEAGGMGVLGPNAGQTTLTTDPIETAERMRKEIIKTRRLTDKPFAVQYIVPMPAFPSTYTFSGPILNVLEEEEVKYVLASGYIITEEIKKLKDKGFTVIFRDLDPTIEAAKAAEEVGVDVLIATGYNEGGAMPSRRIGTLTIVPMIVDAVKTPVLAAGGIVDNRRMKAVIDLGAQGAYIGTLFVVSKECPASEICKQDIVNSESKDLVEFFGIPTFWRATPHKLALELAKMTESGSTREDVAARMNDLIALKAGMLDGDLENGINSVSDAVSDIKSIRTCKEIINDLVRGMEF